mmetsp:Transcript_9480/g.21272  ORF Transcript_9480/g.21272 Transcript_9480/m.21272 type:complete len:188 (+) Transcript_9480:59-622(+)
MTDSGSFRWVVLAGAALVGAVVVYRTVKAGTAPRGEEEARGGEKKEQWSSYEAQKAAYLAQQSQAEKEKHTNTMGYGIQLTDALEEQVRSQLEARFQPLFLQIENQGACEAPKLAVRMVSLEFEGVSRIERGRMVNTVLGEDLLSGRLHALSTELRTPMEFAKAMKKDVGKFGSIKTKAEFVKLYGL